MYIFNFFFIFKSVYERSAKTCMTYTANTYYYITTKQVLLARKHDTPLAYGGVVLPRQQS